MTGDAFFKTREETKAWLDAMCVKSYTIQDDLTVDVDGDVNISYKKLTAIPVQFGVVNGYFNCSGNQLTDLNGAPVKCHGLSCATNKLTNLIGAPKDCWWLDCDFNQLASLDGAPDVCGEIFCEGNQLTRLDGVSTACTAVWCRNNPDLWDTSAVPEGCSLKCDHDVIARNKATRQLTELESANPGGEVLNPNPGRML